MRQDTKDRREVEIAQAAYDIMAEKGFGGLSMLAVAKRAKASNETLYRWYGDKLGLFRALIDRNASEVAARFEQAIASGDKDLAALGLVLLRMLLSARAVALNRAAACDASDQLGAVLAEAGRGRIYPLIVSAMPQNAALPPERSAALWVDLLVGDLQIRCATGAMTRPDEDALASRARRAAALLALHI